MATAGQHPHSVADSASVHPDAVLAPGVSVGHGVVIEAGVTIGENTEVLTGSVLHSGSHIGRDCRLGPYAVIGGEPLDTAFAGEPSTAVVEDSVRVREFATIHRATGVGAETRVGAGSLVMSYAHVSHNVRVGRGCVLTTAVQLGGHSQVGDHAVIGSGTLLHQFCRVGAYAMFGAGSATNTDVLPFSMARGNPTRHYRLNSIGLKRHGITGDRYLNLESALRAIRKRDVARLEELAAANEDARLLLEFIRSSKRGIARFVTAD